MPDRYVLPSSEHRELFESRSGLLRPLCDAINSEFDFGFDDWQLLFYVLENYHPDFIFELGRGNGNSTSVICDYCLRNPGVGFTSVDLFDAWGKEIVKNIPDDIPSGFYKHDFQHLDFMEFDHDQIRSRQWEKLLVFWDVNDEFVARKLVEGFLSEITDRQVLVCMHDVSLYSGRPNRIRWNRYESMFKDLEIAGDFIDRNGCGFGMPDTEKVFGHYRNAGHWLLFELPRKTDKNRKAETLISQISKT